MITFNKEQQVFHLCNNQISYLIEVEEHGYLAQLYFGKKINHYSGHYQYVRDQLCVLSGANWNITSNAGVWAGAWNNYRTNAYYYTGFRSASFLVS